MSKTHPYVWLCLCLGAIWACSSDSPLSYSSDVKPILNENCLACHGGIKQLGGFSLLFEEDALAENESGKPAIIPGNSRQSELIRRLRTSDPEIRMPQDHEPLPESQIRILEQWIDEGAKWDQHWAYAPLKLPEVPEIDTAWGLNEIDKFIYRQLVEQNLRPSGAASDANLARRLSFDLLGLPPDQEQVAIFLDDPGKENYARLVDTLLRSPHFGEKLAAMWLDLARYADSNGYEKDMGRSVWRYRDWVIKAFNADMPFDQFTIEQLAGDRLPSPDHSQLIATAFHRNTMTNTEGGTEDEEFRTMSVMDRVNTTFEVWQATTMSCVQCHSHPYDPFRMEDYYHAFAYLNNTQDADLDSEYPYLLETDQQQADMKEVIGWINELEESPSAEGVIDRDLIRQTLFPRLQADFADDFQHVLISHDGTFSNSSYNSNNQKHKKYFLLFEDIPLDQLQAVRYHYFSKGDDALIEVRLDSVNGPVISSAPMLASDHQNPDWQWKSFPVETKINGMHDLIFCFINTTGDFHAGVVTLDDIILDYAGISLENPMIEYQDSLLALYRKGVKTPIMKNRSEQLWRETHIFERGNYLVKGDKVTPAVPGIFADPEKPVNNRLEFAQWMVSDANPLTARVIVNRIWEQIFGRGIVETVEDFGTQGSTPTHEELLNYLAYRFSHDWNWSVKRLIREMVTSATYQQSSKVTTLQLEKDPDNIWYGRGSRTRLTAEQIRDQALAVSGLLNPRIGGKSVMPPQPDGVWQIVYSNARWKAEKEEDKYRRGLYTYWKRTTPYPSMIAFDAPSREFCVSRRIGTNTPLQALVTLNDPVFVEAAEALATWMKQQGKGDLEKAIMAGYKKILLIPPEPMTIEVLSDLFEEANQPLPMMIAHKEEKDAVLKPMTVVANALLNLDAVLNKS